MPPKKGTKKQAGAKGKVGQSRMKADASAEALPSPSTTTLDIAAHPYILSLIIEHSSRDTILALLRCSKQTFEAAARKLYKHLRLTQDQFTDLIAIGNAPSKGGITSGSLGRSFSPYLRFCLEQVRCLHFTRHNPKWLPPPLPRGVLANLSTFVLCRQTTIDENQYPYFVPAPMLARISKNIDHVTMIYPNPWYVGYDETTSLRLQDFVKTGRTVTIVLKPFLAPPSYAEFMLPDLYAGRIWNRLPPRLGDSTKEYPIRIVGAEYTGRLPTHQLELPSTDMPVQNGPIFTPFYDWLEAQGTESMFSGTELARFKEIHRRLADEEQMGQKEWAKWWHDESSGF